MEEKSIKITLLLGVYLAKKWVFSKKFAENLIKTGQNLLKILLKNILLIIKLLYYVKMIKNVLDSSFDDFDIISNNNKQALKL